MRGETIHCLYLLKSTVGKYEVHLCSARCKKTFDADPDKAILAAKAAENRKG